MKEIKLTRGMVAIVDDEDYERVSEKKWWATVKGYAISKMPHPTEEGKKTTIFMHRFILGMSPDDPLKTDHINRNRLDNRRSNLRKCTPSQNSMNRVHKKDLPKGVQRVTNGKNFMTKIKINGKAKHLGCFETPELAHEFYCLAADMLHGEFANHG